MQRRTLLRSIAAFAPVVFAPSAHSTILPWLTSNAGEAVKSAMDRSNLAPAYEMWRNQEPRVESIRLALSALVGVDAELQ